MQIPDSPIHRPHPSLILYDSFILTIEESNDFRVKTFYSNSIDSATKSIHDLQCTLNQNPSIQDLFASNHCEDRPDIWRHDMDSFQRVPRQVFIVISSRHKPFFQHTYDHRTCMDTAYVLFHVDKPHLYELWSIPVDNLTLKFKRAINHPDCKDNYTRYNYALEHFHKMLISMNSRCELTSTSEFTSTTSVNVLILAPLFFCQMSVFTALQSV